MKTQKHECLSDLKALAEEKGVKLCTTHLPSYIKYAAAFRASYDREIKLHYCIVRYANSLPSFVNSFSPIDFGSTVLYIDSIAVRTWIDSWTNTSSQPVIKKRKPKRAGICMWDGNWYYTRREEQIKQWQNDFKKFILTSDLDSWLKDEGLTREDIIKAKK